MVHIHTVEPDTVIKATLDSGRLVGIRIEIFDEPVPTSESTRILIAMVLDSPLKNLITSSGTITISSTPAWTPMSTPTDCAATTDQESADNVVTKTLTVMQDADEAALSPNGLISDQELMDIEFAAAATDLALAVVSAGSVPADLVTLAVHSAELPLVVAIYAIGEAANGTRTVIVAADVNKPLAGALTGTISDLLAGSRELMILLLGRGAEDVDIAEVRVRPDKPVGVAAYDATGTEEPVQTGIEQYDAQMARLGLCTYIPEYRDGTEDYEEAAYGFWYGNRLRCADEFPKALRGTGQEFRRVIFRR